MLRKDKSSEKLDKAADGKPERASTPEAKTKSISRPESRNDSPSFPNLPGMRPILFFFFFFFVKYVVFNEWNAGIVKKAKREDSPMFHRRRNSSVIETTTISMGNRGQGEEINQYRILHEIGKGSYGSVYKAVNKDTGDPVAIKAISKMRLRKRNKHKRESTDELLEITHEVAILKKISAHPYFVRLIEFLNCDTEDSIFMGMQSPSSPLLNIKNIPTPLF